MHRLFYLVWLTHLVLLAGSGNALPEWVGSPGKQLPRDDYLLLMGAVALLVPLACGPGLMALLRRLRSGGVNLPHADYWFRGDRRAASLQRLEPHVLGLATLVTLVLAAQHGLALAGLQQRIELHLALAGLFLMAVLLGVTRLLRAFPAPPPPEDGGRRPDRTRRGQP